MARYRINEGNLGSTVVVATELRTVIELAKSKIREGKRTAKAVNEQYGWRGIFITTYWIEIDKTNRTVAKVHINHDDTVKVSYFE